MKNNEPSITSLLSAYSRAYHSKYDAVKIIDDFLAADLITAKEFSSIEKNLIEGIFFFNPEIAVKFQHQPEKILQWIVHVQLSPATLSRTAFCEDRLLTEVKLGAKQYVSLGAGLDTFCFRNPHLNNRLTIFEVDYPATQNIKKERLANANYLIPNHLHFIALDFTKKFTIQDLCQAGFITNNKTVFSLLGVSYYLTKEEFNQLLNELFAHVPAGSSILFDYADEHLFTEKGYSNRIQHMVEMASASGEPMKSCFTYDEMENMLESNDLLIYEHLPPAAINQHFFHNRSDYLTAFETFHFIHAVKK